MDPPQQNRIPDSPSYAINIHRPAPINAPQPEHQPPAGESPFPQHPPKWKKSCYECFCSVETLKVIILMGFQLGITVGYSFLIVSFFSADFYLFGSLYKIKIRLWLFITSLSIFIYVVE